EWISSVDLENIALGHPASAACAVIGIPHPKWDERPLLIVQLKPGAVATADDYRRYLADKIAKWWMPDDIAFVDAIPLGATGKVDKKVLRRKFVEEAQINKESAPINGVEVKMPLAQAPVKPKAQRKRWLPW